MPLSVKAIVDLMRILCQKDPDPEFTFDMKSLVAPSLPNYPYWTKKQAMVNSVLINEMK